MKAKSRQSGLTLTEMTVVIVTVALLTSFGLPAVRTLFNSMATSGGTRAMISAALASARAIAAKEQRYAGIRFQEDLYGHQYIIFIIHDPEIGAYFFRAVEGIQPIKLPDNFGVMDFTIVTDRNTSNPVNSNEVRLDDPSLSPSQDDWINNDFELTDTTTFSIIFSPSGKLVIHGIRVRNRDGKTSAAPIQSKDDIFNTEIQVTSLTNPFGMFIQDDYAANGLGPEPSRRSFIIYDKTQFDKIDADRRWSGYLWALDAVYINPYTGTMIKR